LAKLPFPGAPPGPFRELLEELHNLHARAGWPSVRELARGQNFSHTAVHELFTKVGGAPKLPVLFAVVERLAALAPRADAERVLDKFDELWRTLLKEPVIASGPPTETVTSHDHPIVLNQGVLDMGKPMDELGALTQRELEVLELVTTGMSDFEIARWLNITSKKRRRSHGGYLLQATGNIARVSSAPRSK